MLKELADRGIIAFPKEEEEDFLARVPQTSFDDPALDTIESLFGMRPNWVEVSYTKKGLRLWEGGFFVDEKITLHPIFLKKEKLFFYSRNEILSHELVHAIRSHFNEPIFEEFLAYMTSKSSFRRCFGPLFQNPNESLIFLLLGLASSILMPWTLLPLFSFCGYLGFLLIRLLRCHHVLKRALERVNGNRGALLFLKDSEIVSLSKDALNLDKNEIRVRQFLAFTSK